MKFAERWHQFLHDSARFAISYCDEILLYIYTQSSSICLGIKKTTDFAFIGVQTQKHAWSSLRHRE